MDLTSDTYLRYKNNVLMESIFENSELILLDFESEFDKYKDILFNDITILNFKKFKFKQLLYEYKNLIQTFISKYINHDDLTNINNWFLTYTKKCKYYPIFEYIKIELIPIYVSNYINNRKLFVNHFLEELESLYGNNTKLTYKNSIPLNKIHFSLYINIIRTICTFYVKIYFNICNEDQLNSILYELIKNCLPEIAFCKYETIQDIKNKIFKPLNMETIFYESYLEFMDDLQIKSIVMTNTFKLNDLIIHDKINYFIFKNLISRFDNEVLLHNLECLMSRAINQEIYTIIESGKSFIVNKVYSDYLID